MLTEREISRIAFLTAEIAGRPKRTQQILNSFNERNSSGVLADLAQTAHQIINNSDDLMIAARAMVDSDWNDLSLFGRQLLGAIESYSGR